MRDDLEGFKKYILNKILIFLQNYFKLLPKFIYIYIYIYIMPKNSSNKPRMQV